MTSYTISPQGSIDLVLGPDLRCVGKLWRDSAPEVETWVANVGSGGSTTHPDRNSAYRAVVAFAETHPGQTVE